MIAAGALVLLGSLWLDWYRVEIPEPPRGSFPMTTLVVYDAGEGSASGSAWSLFSAVDVLLALLAAALLVVAVRPINPWRPRVLAAIAAVVVLFRFIVPPYDLLEPGFGSFLALAAVLAIVAWPDPGRRVTLAQRTAGLGGFALLLSVGLMWFDAMPSTGWTRYAPIDDEPWDEIVSGLVAVLAVPALLVPWRPGLARVAGTTGWLALGLVIGRLVFAPNDQTFALGALVALLAAAVAWAGALLSARGRRAVA